MKVAVPGAGTMAWSTEPTSRAGADVTRLDVNEAHLDAINRNGLHVTVD